MKPGTVTLLYFSPTGTTRTILERIASSIRIPVGQAIDMTRPDVRNQAPFEFSNELVIIGSPVYSGRLPEDVSRYLKTTTAFETPAVLVVVYGNRAFDDALLELRDITVANGFIPVAGAAFIGEHSFCHGNFKIAAGRPDETDLEQAHAFGKEIKNLMRRTEQPTDLVPVDVPGSFPYKTKPVMEPFSFIQVTDDCDGCGICLEACPENAIDEKNGYATVDESCIHCCACIKACPLDARVMKDSPILEIAKKLTRNCVERKMPETFFAVDERVE